MKNATRLRDPTAELSGARRARLEPPASLEGKTIALLDIGKTRSSEFIDRIEQLCADRGLQTRRYRKPTNTRTAPREVIESITLDADVAMLALSD